MKWARNMPDLMKCQQIPRFYSAIEETWKKYAYRSKRNHKQNILKHKKSVNDSS